MSSRSLRARFGRAALVGLLAWMGVAGVPAVAVAQEVSDQQAEDEVEARIAARRHDDDRVEFGLQFRLPGGQWTERVLPTWRFFPPGPEVGRWLASSSVVLRRDGETEESASSTQSDVRIAAQRVADGRIEFALQQRLPGETWGERLLPRRRFFPRIRR